MRTLTRSKVTLMVLIMIIFLQVLVGPSASPPNELDWFERFSFLYIFVVIAVAVFVVVVVVVVLG